MTRILADASSLERVIPSILGTICARLEWDCGNVWIVDADRATLRHSAEWHRPQDHLGGFGLTVASLTFRPGVGMAGRVWDERRPIWVPDLAVEVTSSEPERDRLHKLHIYCDNRVPWYWIIDSKNLAIEEYRATPEGYVRKASIAGGEEFRPGLFPGLVINLAALLASSS